MKKFFHEGWHRFITILLLGIITVSAYGENIPANIDQILAHYKNAKIGVQVQSMSTGQIIYQHNSADYFAPASVMKNFTAVAALTHLGPDYTFKTQLLANTFSIREGALNSNLYVKFDGDPTLTYKDLEQLFAKLTAAGVRTIRGNVYVDDTLFDQIGYAPGWSDEERNFCYAAPIGAALINKNCFGFSIAPGRAGQHAVLRNSTMSQFVSFNNSVITAARRTRGCGLNVQINENNTYDLSGCIRRTVRSLGFAIPVSNPRLYSRNMVQYLLRQAGVHVTGQITFQKTPPGLIVLTEHQSASLAVLVRQMLKKSDNIIAGALYKKIGATLYGQGTWQTGNLALAQILGKNAQVDFKQLRIIDGSGLSPYNLITPQQMSKLLYFAYHNTALHQPFFQALPISGIDGTLRYRMGNKGMIRRVNAKTGTIKHVTALAGYVNTNRYGVLSFVILVNANGPTSYYRTVEDRICTFLAHA